MVGIVLQPYVAIEWDVCMYVRACVAWERELWDAADARDQLVCVQLHDTGQLLPRASTSDTSAIPQAGEFIHRVTS